MIYIKNKHDIGGNSTLFGHIKELVRYKARFLLEESMYEYPKVDVITPEGGSSKVDSQIFV